MVYFYYLEIALADSSDDTIYAFENLSHIPASKLIEIFNIDIKSDPNISEGYFLTRSSYQKHKGFIEKNMGSINLAKFEYTLRLYADSNPNAIDKLYKKHFLE